MNERADAPIDGATAPPRRSPLAVPALLGLAIMAVVLAVWVVSSVRPTMHPADTPEGTFQRYYEAWADGDLDTAYSFFSSGVQQSVSPERYRRVATEVHGYGGLPGNTRVTLSRTTVRGERATLELAVEHHDGGILGGSWSYATHVLMVHEDSRWRISQPMIGLERVGPLEFEDYGWDY